MTANVIVPLQQPASINLPAMPSFEEVRAMSEMARIAALSNFVNSQARNPEQRTADAFFVMMYGRELGIPAMTSLQQIYVIDGKPSCSGQMMLALAIKAGVEVVTPDPSTVKDKCEIKMRRPGKEWQTFTFTRDMANAAGLVSRRNWKMYFANMMIWRTISMGLKIVAPDIIAGLYTIEEISPDTAVDESGAVVDTTSLPGFAAPQAEEATTPAQQPTTSQKTAQTGTGRDSEPVEEHSQEINGDDPADLLPPTWTVVNKVKVMSHGNGVAYYCSLTNIEQPLWLFSRGKFRDAGYQECDAWTEIGEVYTPSVAIPVQIEQRSNGKRTWLDLLEVRPVKTSMDDLEEIAESAAPK